MMESSMEENRRVVVKAEHVSKKFYIGRYTGKSFRKSVKDALFDRKDNGVGDIVLGENEMLALNDVSFEVYEGETFGIIGRNGAGKSTLLKILCEITAPTRGEIDIFGRISSMLEVGSGFDKELTGRENIYLNGTILGMTKEEIDAKIDDIIEFSELEGFIDTPVKWYSSGMYTKLAFSVAANLDNEILIMDEVLAAGDIAFREKCLGKIISKAEEGKTVLYVGHNMMYLRKLCTRCMVLDKGKKVFIGDTDDAIQYYLDNIEIDAQTKAAKDGSAGAAKKSIQGSIFTGTKRDVRDKERSKLIEDHRMHLNEVEYPGRDNIQFKQGEKAVITYRWSVLRQYTDLCLRIEVYTSGDTHIASYVLYDIGDGEPGEEKELTVKVGLNYFVPSLYKFKQTFFFRRNGAVFNTDRVIGLSFEMVKETEEYWDPHKMSSLKMNDIEIVGHSDL